jgi:hypothetical protein
MLSGRMYIALLLFILSAIVLCHCKSKKKPRTGDEIADVKDFIEFFPQAVKSVQFNDSILLRKEKDSAAISYKTLTQFIPDSILSKTIGKAVKPKTFPLARLLDGNSTNYLISKTVTGDSRSLILYCFDKNDKLIAAGNMLKLDQSPATTQSFSIDRNFNISKNIIRKNADGTQSDGKEVYVLNEEAKSLMLILTDQLDDKATEFVNPIDTFPRKQKVSGDYLSGKNLVSIRDSKKTDRVAFFIHFQKNNGQCNGELKGEALLTGKNIAEYRVAGDPCVMRFNFSASAVSIKEIEGCAAHRGLRCSFDGNYARKKAGKPKK